MPRYQLQPYLLRAYPKNAPGRTRPTTDYRAVGEPLIDDVAALFACARGVELHDPSDPDRSLLVQSVQRGERTLFCQISPGTRGLVSTLRLNGQTHERSVEDSEYPPVRYLAYFPPGGHAALLFTEKVGGSNAMGLVSRLLKATFCHYWPLYRMEIAPAMTRDVLRAWYEQAPLKGLVYKRPARGDRSGKLVDVNGEKVNISVSLKARRGRTLAWAQREAATSGDLLGFLSTRLGLNVDVLQGWEAGFEVQTSRGRRRQVWVTGAGPATMTFPVALRPDGSPAALDGRPDDEIFRSGCTRIMQDFAGQFDIPDDVDADCRWEPQEWHPGSPRDGWRPQWGEADAGDTGSP
jgi:hypothetical protein